MRTPILETKRLILKPLELSDAQAVFDTWSSDPRVTKFMFYVTHKNVCETEAWITDMQKNLDSDTQYDWGFFLKDEMKLIGSGGAYYKSEQDAYNIGYNIAFDYWHQGITTEAMQAVLEFLKNTLHAKHIVSDHAVENPNSGKVMEKLGLRYDHDGEYAKFDGSEIFKAKFYRLDL